VPTSTIRPLPLLPLRMWIVLRGCIEIADIERRKLTASHASRVKGFQNRTITDAERTLFSGGYRCYPLLSGQ
jgi:hypothetical protein